MFMWWPCIWGSAFKSSLFSSPPMSRWQTDADGLVPGHRTARFESKQASGAACTVGCVTATVSRATSVQDRGTGIPCKGPGKCLWAPVIGGRRHSCPHFSAQRLSHPAASGQRLVFLWVVIVLCRLWLDLLAADSLACLCLLHLSQQEACAARTDPASAGLCFLCALTLAARHAAFSRFSLPVLVDCRSASVSLFFCMLGTPAQFLRMPWGVFFCAFVSDA